MIWLARRRRGAIALEAVMVLPTILVVFGAVAQIMITAQGRMFVEQAAYAAARSALVHMCRPTDVGCTSQPQKWEDAARWSLVSAASTKAGSNCPSIIAGQQVLTADNRIAGRDEAARNALCYAFAPGNIEVNVDWDYSAWNPMSGPDNIPVRATVRFKLPLSTPFRKFVEDGVTNDIYWRWGEATVVLL